MFLEAPVLTVVTDNDVIDHVHADDLADLHQVSCQREIVVTWRRIAARMIVRVMCRRSLCGRGQWKPPITPVDTLIAGT